MVGRHAGLWRRRSVRLGRLSLWWRIGGRWASLCVPLLHWRLPWWWPVLLWWRLLLWWWRVLLWWRCVLLWRWPMLSGPRRHLLRRLMARWRVSLCRCGLRRGLLWRVLLG